MTKIHLVPGWAEGNWQFKQFASAFGNKFELSRDSAQADVIIAHSSGCYSLPEVKHAKLVVLIDPPYWPGRSLAIRIFRCAVRQVPTQLRSCGLIWWLKLRFWNLLYLIIEPWRHIKVWRSIRKSLLLSLDAQKAILIWNCQDAYCGPAIKDLASGFPSLKLIEMPGLHEDVWMNPQSYIGIIKKEL